MRILYGFSGEGSGHSSRARAVLPHLIAAGHDVRPASYDRGLRDLSADHDVLPLQGLTIGTRNNRMSPWITLRKNAGRLPEIWRSWVRVKAFAREFQPHVIISDFEPLTAHLAKLRRIPLISLDNQHRMRFMAHPVPAYLTRDAWLTRRTIQAFVPEPDACLVTTFWFGDVDNERTLLVPPVLPARIRQARPERGEHVLVYFTQGFDGFLEHIAAREDTEFRIYGQGREGVEGHLRFRPFSRDGFLEDLRTARAVISTAGFTLMSECLHLAKPLLALPMGGQFEQELNALLLEDLGLGVNGREASADVLARFLDGLPGIERAVARPGRHRAPDNGELLGHLDRLLADGAAELHALRERRLAE